MYGQTHYSPVISLGNWIPWRVNLFDTPEQRRYRRIKYGGKDETLQERFCRKMIVAIHEAIHRGKWTVDTWTTDPEYARLRRALDHYEDRAEYYARKAIQEDGTY